MGLLDIVNPTKLATVKPNKMRIAAFLDSGFTRPLMPKPNEMSLDYDPESLSIKQKNNFGNEDQGPSTSSTNASFYACGARELSVSFSFVGVDSRRYGFINSTLPYLRSDQASEDMKLQLEAFRRLCQRINGESHEPSYLRLNWGTGGLGSTFEARLSEYTITYGLFDRCGRALLADLKAVFVEAVEPKKQAARTRCSSPDLSHRHLVLAGETLPMLCLRYYGTTDPYLQVAAFNQLDDIRALTPGQQLLFPPLNAPGGQGG
jgi:hypothetical protein